MSHILKWSIAFVAVTAILRLIQLGLFGLFAAILPIEIFGAFGVYYAFQTAMATFAATGLVEDATAQLRFHAGREARRALYEETITSFLFTSTASAVVLGVAVAITRGLSVEGVAALLAGACIALATLQGSLLRLEERLGASLTVSAGVLLTSLSGMAAALLVAPTVGGLFSAAAAGSCISLAVFMRKGTLIPPVAPQWRVARRKLWPLLPYFVIAVLGWLGGYGINVVIVHIVDVRGVAIFTFLLAISSTSQMVATAMNSAWTPRFYTLYNAGLEALAEERAHSFHKAQILVMGGIGIGAVLVFPHLALLSPNLAAYTTHTNEVSYLFAAYVLVVPWYHASSYYYVNGKGDLLMSNLVVSGVLGLAAWIALLALFGLTGVFVGFMLNTALKAFLAWRDAARRWPLQNEWRECIAVAVIVLAIGAR